MGSFTFKTGLLVTAECAKYLQHKWELLSLCYFQVFQYLTLHVQLYSFYTWIWYNKTATLYIGSNHPINCFFSLYNFLCGWLFKVSQRNTLLGNIQGSWDVNLANCVSQFLLKSSFCYFLGNNRCPHVWLRDFFNVTHADLWMKKTNVWYNYY